MRGKIRRTRSQIRRPRRLPRLRRARRPRLERRNFFRDGQACQKMQRELQDLRRLPLSGAPACFLCFAEDGQPAGRQRVLSVSFRAEPPQSGVCPCVISKACVVLPCLQGVKRVRRNRQHMGACPRQLVAKSVSFFAADYSPPFLLGGSFFGSQGLSPCNAYALRRAFALVRLKRDAWLCPCKQAKPSRPFRVTQKSSRAPLSSRACRGICPPVIPSLSRDLYGNIEKI